MKGARRQSMNGGAVEDSSFRIALRQCCDELATRLIAMQLDADIDDVAGLVTDSVCVRLDSSAATHGALVLPFVQEHADGSARRRFVGHCGDRSLIIASA